MIKIPVVSIITPLYNSSPFVADTIRSILAQTLTGWEMIIVDDCSTDDSVEIVQRFVEQDSRIKLIKLDRNSGPAVARNTALEAANCRYIAFSDSDDQWLPQKLEKQIAFMRANGYAFTCTHYEKVLESGERTGQIVTPPDHLSYADMLKSNQIGCLSTIYDSQMVGKVYMPLIRKRQDFGLWLKLLKIVPYVYCLPEVLALYRVRDGSVSSNKIEMLLYNWKLYRMVEKLSFLRSVYYLGWNIVRKVLK